jgi:amidophosphoribosyltransferase
LGLDGDLFHDECGIFGVCGHVEASRIAYLGLHSLQHRGQESAGMAVANGTLVRTHRQMGLVQEAFDSPTLDRLTGDTAIGHVRYSTAGSSHIRNAQPISAQTGHGHVSVVHNGTLTNAMELRHMLERVGSIFHSNSDTESFVHLIARSRRSRFVDRILEAVAEVRGAYSLLFLSESQVVALRDAHGFRPLSLGVLDGSPVIASESCAFDLIGARLVRDVAPGEVLVMDRDDSSLDGVQSLFPLQRTDPHMCIFEFIYFAKPNSVIGGRSVYEARIDMGRRLAEEHPAEADLVIPVPDSGTPAAIGYARGAGLPFELGFIRSHYVGRTFIEPKSSIRHFGVKLKLSAVASLLRGKRVVVVDDSIVRGTTSQKIVKMLRDAGAKEVHVRISSPPTRHSCFYGIDTPTRGELIASKNSVEDILAFLEADSLGYLSLEGAHRAAGQDGSGYCDACFSGDYPVPVPRPVEQIQTRLEGL